MTQEYSASGDGRDGVPSAQAFTPSGFLAALFGAYTDTPVFVCSYANEDAPPGHKPREILTRSAEDIDGFVRKNDAPHRACYFGVATLRADAAPRLDENGRPKGSRRTKENAAQIITLHAEIDLKSIFASREDVLAALDRLPLPPLVVVDSGNGFHCYWLLSEAIDATPETIALIENLNQQLADLVGGDSVRDVSRLLRIPGTHNTKLGAWKPVTVIRAQFEPRYELSDLEEMLTQLSPVIKRRPSEKAKASAASLSSLNPFERIAATLGFKAPVDVEQRLSLMDYQGTGDTSIHHTQLACSASLMNRGVPIDEVVETLLSATQAAAGEMGKRWNWTREEAGIRRMCEDWQRKHPDHVVRPLTRQEATAQITGEAPAPSARARSRDTSGEVVSLSEARTNRKTKPKPRQDGEPSAMHIIVGQTMLERLAETGEAILFTKKAAYHYSDGLWLMEVDGLKAWMDVKLQEVAEGLGLESTNRLLSEARGWVTRRPSLWRDNVTFDVHGMIPTKSGLLDPRTLALTPAQPSHYCTWRVEAEFDPSALCPIWDQMLGDTFADRAPAQKADVLGVLQEVLGCALLDVKPRGMSRALVLVGGSNYGKSGVLDVFSGLFGEDANSTSLDQIEGTHGLMAFMRRVPWVLHEAFNQAKWHTSSTVKAIITGDPVPINIKNGPIINQRIRAPIFWGTNSPPQFKETTLAVVNRLLIIHCKRIFDDRLPVGAALEAHRLGFDRPSNLVLATERSGLLNWALAGMQRALARGAIIQTDETREAGEEMHRDSNLAAGFIADCVSFDADFRVSVPDFCAAFSAWWAQEKGTDRFVPSNEAISKAVVALGLPQIAYHPLELRDNKRRYYCGVKLNTEGEEFWKRALTARAFEGKLASTTPDGDPVNTVIPEAWSCRASIKSMRLAAVSVARNGVRVSSDHELTLSKTDTAKTDTPRTDTGTDTGQLTPVQAVDPEGDSFF